MKYPAIVDALLGAATNKPFGLGVGIESSDETPDATTFDLGAGVVSAPRRQGPDARKRAKRGLAKLRKALT